MNEFISNTNVIEDFDNNMLQKGFIHKNDIIKIKCSPINPDVEYRLIYSDNITQQTILLMKFKNMINIDNKTSKEYTSLSEFIQKEIFKFKLKQYSLSVLELKTLDNILNSNFEELKHFVYLKTQYKNVDIVKSGFFTIQW